MGRGWMCRSTALNEIADACMSFGLKSNFLPERNNAGKFLFILLIVGSVHHPSKKLHCKNLFCHRVFEGRCFSYLFLRLTQVSVVKLLFSFSRGKITKKMLQKPDSRGAFHI